MKATDAPSYSDQPYPYRDIHDIPALNKGNTFPFIPHG